MSKIRVDQRLVELGLCDTVAQAAALVMARKVRGGTDSQIVIEKPGELIAPHLPLKVLGSDEYVSRGGKKLKGALRAFEYDVSNKRAIDLGASTGGFTDCLLKSGASSVVAVDVGYGQLAWSLQSDARVRVCDRTNIRHADVHELGGPFDIVVADLSFISLSVVLAKVVECMGHDGDAILLIKPQFEVGSNELGEHGVVSDQGLHVRVLKELMELVSSEELLVQGLTYSPITGPEGNIEYWIWFSAKDAYGSHKVKFEVIPELVREAHARLGKG